MKSASGGMDYEGGETRMISIPNYCTHAELLEALERVTTQQTSTSSSSGSVSFQRFILPLLRKFVLWWRQEIRPQFL